MWFFSSHINLNTTIVIVLQITDLSLKVYKLVLSALFKKNEQPCVYVGLALVINQSKYFNNVSSSKDFILFWLRKLSKWWQIALEFLNHLLLQPIIYFLDVFVIVNQVHQHFNIFFRCISDSFVNYQPW